MGSMSAARSGIATMARRTTKVRRRQPSFFIAYLRWSYPVGSDLEDCKQGNDALTCSGHARSGASRYGAALAQSREPENCVTEQLGAWGATGITRMPSVTERNTKRPSPVVDMTPS